MAWSDAGRDLRASSTGALIDGVSLHSGSPGSDGTANEVSGDGYSRQSPNFSASGVGQVNDTLTYSGPSEQAVDHIGLWNGETFLGSAARSGGDGAFNAAGEYNVDLTVTATGDIEVG